MENIRIGNLEYLAKTNEIVLWYPNEFYGAQKRLAKDGYRKLPDGSMSKDGVVTVNFSCFEHEFHCYTVADIEWHGDHDEFDVRSIGTRAFDLEGKDFTDFNGILRKIEEQNNSELHQ
jgi:hypothetical protein